MGRIVITFVSGTQLARANSGRNIFFFFSFSIKVVRFRFRSDAASFLFPPVFSSAWRIRRFSNSSTALLRQMPSLGEARRRAAA
jgi:hypothetical protein